MRYGLALISALFLLSACDSTRSLTQLRHATPHADPYQAALAAGYRDYAAEQQQAYQWWTSKYFADKGLLAAYGTATLPEDPARWDIARPVQPELRAARTQLLAALPAARQSAPGQAASAVLAYERWLVLADHGWDTPRIDDARDRFFTLLGALPQPGVPAAAAPAPVETTSTVLYFPFDSASLSGSAQMALGQLVQYVRSSGQVGITINGHADRVGTDQYNMSLSQSRAQFVRDALLAAGVPAHRVQYFAFGESDPDIDTADGEEEPLNRRVEIFIE